VVDLAELDLTIPPESLSGIAGEDLVIEMIEPTSLFSKLES